LKVSYSKLKCPHCGSGDFNLLYDDVFLCEYCQEKFNFNIEEIDFSEENEIFIQELKEQFANKVRALHDEIIKNRAYLNEYSKKANPRKLIAFSIALIIFAFLSIFSYVLVGLPLLAIGVALYVFAKKNEKNKRQTYQPKANFYASKIVELSEQIDYYTRLLSKLTK
jgi:hypothetical protein